MARVNATHDTANDRFKSTFGGRFWYSIAVAAVLHFTVFAFFPEMSSAVINGNSDELVAVDIPESIEIPPPPEVISRPATPVMSATAIDPDATIPPTPFDAFPTDRLSPPPATRGERDDTTPYFTPTTVSPELTNRAEVQRALVRSYPRLLRDAGIGGTPTVHFHLDETGRVLNRQLAQSSGYPDLDAAALAVADVMKFTPAYNRQERVKVWVEIPIVFTAR